MTIDAENNQLLAQFQNYLEQSSVDDVSLREPPDLHTLLTEMIELKTEVKTQARLFKNTLDTLSSALTSVQDDNKRLSEKLLESKYQQQEVTATMLLAFVETYDRLLSGKEVLQNYHPVKSVFKRSRKHDIKFIKQFQQGQNMSLRRFEQILQRYQVKKIECAGKMFDPALMIAVETETDTSIANGKVLEILQTGFFHKDHVLRLAEVKVNKI